MKKRILILGAGRGQVELIKTAKDMGLHSIVCGLEGDMPGYAIADEVAYVDISDPQKTFEVAKNLNIDAIATSCIDTGIKALGYVCDRLRLSGLTEKSAFMCNDKYLMKNAFAENNVSSPKYIKVTSLDYLQNCINILSFPIIIKAIDLQGSRGIYVCHSIDEAFVNFNLVMNQTKQDYCIVEEFIDGYEFGAQSFVWNNEILFMLIHGDNVYNSHTAVPVGHYVTFEGDNDIINQANKVIVDAIKAIGLNNCAVNIDLIVKDNKVYIIEITGRVGATCLSELVSIYYGINYYEMILLAALGNDPKTIFDIKPNHFTSNASRMIISEKSGVLKEIINKNDLNDESIYDITFFKKHGDEINKFITANDCVGQIVVKGINRDFCFNKINEIIRNIEIIFE